MEADMTYGERLRAKNIGYMGGGRTRDKVVEGRDSDGARTKATTDQLGNTVTEHNNSKDQVDVLIKAPHVRISSREVRQDA